MTKQQLSVIVLSIITLLFLYLGCNKKSSSQKSLEKSRSIVLESTNIENIIQEARAKISSTQQRQIALLEQEIEKASDDSTKISYWQRLSGLWFDYGYPAISGYYAQKIAELSGTENAWSITGTTFAICVKRSEEQKIKEFCSSRAVRSFENAISINPENVAHRVNLALSYTDNPPQDNPMKGIQMLLKLNEQNPDNTIVLNNLASLAIKTGQYDRAIVRIEKILEIDPDNKNALCLAYEAYNGAGKNDKALLFEKKCKALNN